jgi:hypothetical protein
VDLFAPNLIRYICFKSSWNVSGRADPKTNNHTQK